MSPSPELLDFLRWWEGLPGGKPALVAYQCSAGVWTIGFGHTHGVTRWMRCTPEDADRWLAEDAQSAADSINACVTVPLVQHEFDALDAFTLNIGGSAFGGSTMLRKINSADYVGAGDQFARWCMVRGEPNAGLKRRRAAERAIFVNGYYDCRP